jgi:hypothetical protein
MFWRRKPPPEAQKPKGPVLRCSFCNKSQRDVRKLIAGPNVYICDECVDICNDILAEDRKDMPPPDPEWPRSTIHACALCLLPVGIEEAIVVMNRGFLCQGCRGEIEAAIARAKNEG